MVFWLLPIINSFILRKTFPCLLHLAWRALPHISHHLFISLVGGGGGGGGEVGLARVGGGGGGRGYMLRTYQWRLRLAATSPSFVFSHYFNCDQPYLVLQFSTCWRCRPKLLLHWLERIMNCLHSFHLVPRRWAGLQLIVPWTVRLLGCVWFLVLPVWSSAVHSAGEIGWALVTLLCLLSHGEVERHANSGAVFPL